MAARQEIRDPGLAARRAAARILGAVLVERMFLDAAVAEATAELEGPETARARTMADGTLRRLNAIDAVIAPHLRRETPVRVRHVLRIAAWEMLVDNVPSHAAVDGAVRSVKATRKIAQLSGLTNAVARKLAAANLDDTPARLPGYLRKPLVAAYGDAAVVAMEAVQTSPPPVDLTQNAGADYAAAMEANTLPTGSLRLQRAGQISALPGYEDGGWWVQDAAAAMPIRMLGDVAGFRVLDLCAAPGGKTLQLAAAGASVTAVDVSDERLERLRENLARTKLEAEIVCADVKSFDGKGFDVVVLDAPCSATGTLRRHPDLPHVKKDLALEPLLKLQQRLLSKATDMVADGGRLLYCTCSLLPEEGEAQVAPLLANGWQSVGQLPEGCDAEWMNTERCLRLRPDYWAEIGGMDGFFAAVLRKPEQHSP